MRERVGSRLLSGRDKYIDRISGIMILYMMLYHVFQWSDLSEINYSYWMIPLSFFMFWFFYKSGMFYQRKSSSEILCGGGEKVDDSIYRIWFDWHFVE